MRLSHCGANADRHFIEIPNSSGRPEFQWQPVFGHARELPWSFGSHRVPVTPRGLGESGVGILEGSVLEREKLANSLRMKEFRLVPGVEDAWGRMARPGNPSTLTPPLEGSPPRGRSRQNRRPQSEARNPETRVN